MKVSGRRQFLTTTKPAERLLKLERLDRAISERMHRDQRRRVEIQDEARRLRSAFTHEDDVQYRRLRFIAEGR